MADNITLDPGSGGADVATDEIGGKHYQIVKPAFGALDTATLVESTAVNPLPVALSDVDNTVLDNIDTNTTGLAGTIVGSEVQVDIVAPLPPGANTIGDVTVSGMTVVDLSAVDNAVLDDIAGHTSDPLVQLEDTVHSSGDAGIMPLGVRKDSPVALAAENDYHPLTVSSMGGLWIDNVPNVIDTPANSSTATLASGIAFTGTATNILDFAAITVQVDASHDSAVNGLQVQLSPNGTDWDSIHSATYIAANGGRSLQFAAHAQFFRVVYTNGGTGQTHFRLQAILHHTSPIADVSRLDANEPTDKDAVVIKAAILAQTSGTGDFVPVAANSAGKLLVAADVDDGGGSLTVDNDGTFAVQIVDPSFAVADGGALGEGVLIQGDDGTDRKNINVHATTGDVQVDITHTVVVDGSAVTQPISAASLPLPASASTAANQLADGHNVTVDNASGASAVNIQDGGNSLTVDTGATFSVQEDGAALTALQLIDDSIFVDDAAFTLASSKVTVSGGIRDDTLGTLTAVEGDAVPLRVNSTGALHVTGGGGGTEFILGTDTYLEATTAGSIAAVVRKDAGGTLVNTDNEISALQVDSAGALRVTGGGGGTEYNEDDATPATIVGTATLMERDDVLSALTPVAGDWVGLRSSAEGALWTQEFNSDAILADTASMDTNLGTLAGAVTGSEMQVDLVSADVTNAGTFAVQIVDPSFATADGNALGEGVLIQGDDGTDRKNINVDATTGDIQVDITHTVTVQEGAAMDVSAATVTVDNGGTFATQIDAPLPAGTNAIGKLSANTGVDIGDVDILSVIPGTGASNLGKAIDSVVGSTDTGIAMLGRQSSDTAHLATAEGDYDVVRLSGFGALHVEPEQHHVLDGMNATTGWAALGNDTLNLATTLIHVVGSNALTFDKVDGAADTIFGGIEKTLTSIDLGTPAPHDILQTVAFWSDVSAVSYVFLRLGTDATNYNEWRIDGTDLTAGSFETLVFEVGDASHTGAAGNGIDWTAITYCAVGSAFTAETSTLAGMIIDEISFHTNQHVNASLNSEVTSSVSSANINIQKVGNKVVNTQAGNTSTGTQRVTIATDDVNLAAITTAVELIDDAVETHDGAAGTSPLLIAGVAQNMDGTDPPNRVSTEGDATRLATDFDGTMFVHPHGPQIWSYHEDSASALADQSVHADPGAGLSIYVTDIVVSSNAATAMNVFFEEGGTTVLGPYHLEAVAGRGMALHFQTPKKITVATALTVTNSAAITHTIDVTGYIAQG